MATALQHMTECPVCYEPFLGPKLLPCDHSLCTTCVNRIKRGSTRIKCPMCNVSHDADKVRADFRLSQFLDALKEKEQNAEPIVQQKGATSKHCELCSTNHVTFFCEDCEQWMCTVCKNVHLKSTASKEHKVTPLTLKNQEVKDIFERESKKVQEKIDNFSTCNETIKKKLSNIDTVKTDSLQISAELRQKTFDDITKLFDNVDAKIIDFAQSNSIELDAEQSKLEQQKNELQTQWDQLEENVKENANELAVKSDSILDKTKSLLKSTYDTNTDMSEMCIRVLPGDRWDASTAARLELCRAGIQVKPCHSTTVQLSQLTKGTLRKHIEVSLERAPKALRFIKQELWSCQDGGNIQIFDQYLEYERTISNDTWGNVYDVAVLPNEQLVLACSNGLFHIQPNGEQIAIIVEGFFCSAIYYDKILYTYTTSPARICTYILNGDDWLEDTTTTLRCGDWHFVTLSVTKACMLAAYAYEGKIYEMSLRAEIVDRHGQRGEDSAGTDDYLGLPFICQHDTSDTVLTADFDNHRLLILDNKRNWKGVKVEPRPVYPRGAVYTGHTLYIASTGRVYTLSAYVPEFV